WRDRYACAPHVHDQVVDAWIDAEAYRLYTWNVVSKLNAGGTVGADGSVNKLFWSQLDTRIHETALDLLDADAEFVGPGAVDDGAWMDGYLFAISGPIYAGTNEIQRNIVAERVLGLPRGDNKRKIS